MALAETRKQRFDLPSSPMRSYVWLSNARLMASAWRHACDVLESCAVVRKLGRKTAHAFLLRLKQKVWQEKPIDHSGVELLP